MSSIVTAAHALPCLDTLRCRPVIRPAIVTVEPSGRSVSSLRVAIETSAACSRTCSSPARGWSETYSPSISRSNASFCFLSHSGRSGTAPAQLALVRTLRLLVPRRQVGDGDRERHPAHVVVAALTAERGEQVELALGHLALGADHRVVRRVVDRQQRPPGVAERVERARLD